MAKKINFKVINVNLKSPNRKGDAAYEELITGIFKQKIHMPVARDKSMIFRTQHSKMVGKNMVYYGYLSKYTTISGNDWLNFDKMEKEHFEIPPNLFPNLRETIYIFIPGIHRLALINSTGVSTLSTEKFLKNAIESILHEKERVHVVTEQDTDAFDRLLSAKQIIRLEIEVTYSNADLTPEYAEAMDEDFRESGVGEVKIVATPDSSQNIDIEKSKTLSGMAQLSASNGYTKATIIDDNNKRKIIDTKKHPRKFSVQIEDIDDYIRAITNAVATAFRGHGQS